MSKNDNILILFGRSLFINEISHYIPKLCEKYHTMGCNFFCNTFPQVEYVIYYDNIAPDINTNQVVITNKKYAEDENSKSYSILTTHPKCELYNITKSFYFSEDKDTLSMCGHTPSLALNWAYHKGIKNIIIAGIDLDYSSRIHFDANKVPGVVVSDLSQGALIHARKHLKYAEKFLNIVQLNPKSDIDLPKINIEDLI